MSGEDGSYRHEAPDHRWQWQSQDDKWRGSSVRYARSTPLKLFRLERIPEPGVVVRLLLPSDACGPQLALDERWDNSCDNESGMALTLVAIATEPLLIFLLPLEILRFPCRQGRI